MSTFISVTRLRVRHASTVVPFLWAVAKTARQAQQAAGFQGGRVLAESRMVFWTLTAWRDAAAMLAYRNAGAHLAGMHKLLVWCDEAAVAHWEQVEARLPDWPTAHHRLLTEGRRSRVAWPSADQLAGRIAAPRPTIWALPLHMRPAIRVQHISSP
jgi:hypothetical protein